MVLGDYVKPLLRSLCANTPEEEEIAVDNYHHSDLGQLTFEGLAGVSLEKIKQTYLYQNGRPPSTALLIRTAEEEGLPDLVFYLKEVEVEDILWGANYTKLLDDWLDDRGRILLKQVMREVSQIAEEGVEVDREKRQGISEAVVHGLSGLTEIQQLRTPEYAPMDNVRAAEVLAEDYITKRDQPTLAYGMATSFSPLDEATRGGHLGELWTVAGFTSHGKTTLTLNWCRHVAFEGGFNVLIYSLEMSQKKVWAILACSHSAHPKFGRESPLDYEKIQSGTLSEEDDKFYLHEVLPDLKRDDVGHIEVIKPEGPTSMADIRAKAEVLNRTHPLDMIFIDYVNLVDSPKGVRSKVEGLNQNIISAKRMALDFDRGNGLLVVNAHQVNRKGFEEAQKQDGVLEISALAETAEVERSSDVVVTVFQDVPLRQKKEAMITCLKNRDGRIPAPFRIYFPAEYRYCSELAQVNESQLSSLLEA